MLIIEFVKDNDTIIFADMLKGEDFVKCLSKRDIANGNIIVTRR